MKRCKAKGCTTRFDNPQPFVCWCSATCGAEIAKERLAKAKAKKAKDERKADKAKRESLKTRSQWIREAQSAVNKYCRLRDFSRGWGCITCGTPIRTPGPNADAGHWLGRGAYPEKRFNIFNIALQCVHDNQHLGGLPLKFRAALLERYGEELVLKVEAHQPAQKWSIDYLNRLKCLFNKKARRQANRIKEALS